MKPKLLILVMCSSARNYKKLENTIKKTWGSNTHPNVKIIFYRDNYLRKLLFFEKKPVFDGTNLALPCKDGLLECLEKTFQAFEYVSENFQFDYVFRTNLGSYINLKKISEFIEDKPCTKFYCGVIGHFHFNDKIIDFASGSGYFLSHDLIDMILSNRDNFDHKFIDDVAMGAFMQAQGIQINKSARRLSFVNDNIEYASCENGEGLIDDDLIYHVRLRSNNREIDIKRMEDLHNRNF